MVFELVIDAWELECCGPALEPGTLLELTLTATRWPALARLLDWPEVPDDNAVVWPDLPASPSDRAEFVAYGSLHGPDQGPRITLQIGEIREISGELEPDPAGPSAAVRLREDSLRVVRTAFVPARLGLTATDGEPLRSGPPTVAVALAVQRSTRGDQSRSPRPRGRR